MNMQMTDFLCDFCEKPWREDMPFIEGHHGSCICGPCLSVAIESLRSPESTREENCTMCLEAHDEPRWRSPLREASICARCVEQATRVFSKDRSSGWSPP